MGNSFKARLERLSLPDLLKKSLKIPDYQRYYTWERDHVLDLLKDIFDREKPYLMGTVILHDVEGDSSKMDIVDGQQRLVTLTLLLQQLGLSNKITTGLLNAEFTASSAESILKNHDVMGEFLEAKSDEEKNKFSNRLFPNDCDQENGWLLFTVLTLEGENALDRAFTFFDSINSKGMPLTDFNLLKAHHLMFIPPKQEALASGHNEEWEKRNQSDPSHADVFSVTLRRLRMWARREERDSRRERPDYHEFCSVVEPEHGKDSEYELNRYMQPVAFRSWRRVGNRIVLSMDYPALEGEALVPTEITQTIEGGDPFFIYAKRYQELYIKLFYADSTRNSTEIDFVRVLSKNLTNSYLQNAFRSVMLLYIDKFGEDRLIESSVCIERIISDWRWKKKSVRIEGTLSHVKDKQLVPLLLDSVNSLHAYSQLLGICQKMASVPEDVQPESGKSPKGVKQYYYNSIRKFYESEQAKIPDDRTKEIVFSHYNIEN
ncbi:MAG: DUF262 domain-containing protein [SAR324 cluster bacterium]|nr:DUF262 domain-containing protein [SAR324 cluster bacterium]